MWLDMDLRMSRTGLEAALPDGGRLRAVRETVQ